MLLIRSSVTAIAVAAGLVDDVESVEFTVGMMRMKLEELSSAVVSFPDSDESALLES
jgi:hypothetical protein